jgi:3-keto-disaccharide hydrolase
VSQPASGAADHPEILNVTPNVWERCIVNKPNHTGISRRLFLGTGTVAVGAGLTRAYAQPEPGDDSSLPRAFIDGSGPDWVQLGEEHFVNVNCADDTWTWNDGSVHCTGTPTGVMRTKKMYTNFEFVCQWRHLRPAGNSGVFVWTTEASINALTAAGKPGLPQGIEVQVLDLEYGGENPADWYTSHGDVFPVGVEMKPFPPLSPNGVRSFPSKNLTLGVNQWNHYYIRAINGEVRLWVNGEEVSGGTDCNPRSGYLALESEGSPIDFKNLRLRELP